MGAGKVEHVHIRSGNELRHALYVKQIETERDFWRDAFQQENGLIQRILTAVRTEGVAVVHSDGEKTSVQLHTSQQEKA